MSIFAVKVEQFVELTGDRSVLGICQHSHRMALEGARHRRLVDRLREGKAHLCLPHPCPGRFGQRLVEEASSAYRYIRGGIEESQELDQPHEPAAHAPARAHEVPDVEESLADLEIRPTFGDSSHLLDRTLLYQTRELGRDGIYVHPHIRCHILRGRRVPPQREGVYDQLHLRRKRLEPRLVERRAAIQQLFEILLDIPPVSLFEHRIEQGDRTRVATR